MRMGDIPVIDQQRKQFDTCRLQRIPELIQVFPVPARQVKVANLQCVNAEFGDTSG